MENPIFAQLDSLMRGEAVPFLFIGGFFALIIWSIVWKGLGMWKAARHGQNGWFIALLILNTMGILPILYILFFQKKDQ